MDKGTKTHLVNRILLFVIIGILITAALSGIFKTKWTKYEGFYALEENTVEYITLGASHCLYSLNPLYVYAQTKIKGYNMADEAQSIEFSYYWLKEALKKQHPKLVFVDVGNLFYDETYMNEYWKMKEFAGMHISLDKLMNIWDTFGNVSIKIGTVFPLFYFHERWKELSKADFENNPGKTFGSNCVIQVHGETAPTVVNLFEKKCMGDNEYSIENEISDNNWKYFSKMVSLCEKNDIKLIPVKFPTNAWDEERSKIVNDKLNEFGLYLTNLNQRVLGLNWETDSFDEGYHTNYWGNIKTSDTFCAILTEELEGELRASDPEWDMRVKDYADYENEILFSEQDKRDNYWKWLERVKGDNNLILICLNGQTVGDRSEINHRLKQLGLSGYPAEKVKDSFIAVIDDNEIVIEAWDTRIIEYERSITNDCHIRLISSGNKSHIGTALGKAQIYINGENYAEGSAGLNIVVYNKPSKTVVSSMTQYNNSVWNIEKLSTLPEDHFDLFSAPNGWELHFSENNSKVQSITAVYAGNGTYYISDGQARYLSILSGGNSENTPAVWKEFSGTAVQRWMFKDNYDGTYSLVSLYNHKYLSTGVNQLFTSEKSGSMQGVWAEPL